MQLLLPPAILLLQVAYVSHTKKDILYYELGLSCVCIFSMLFIFLSRWCCSIRKRQIICRQGTCLFLYQLARMSPSYYRQQVFFLFWSGLILMRQIAPHRYRQVASGESETISRHFRGRKLASFRRPSIRRSRFAGHACYFSFSSIFNGYSCVAINLLLRVAFQTTTLTQRPIEASSPAIFSAQ